MKTKIAFFVISACWIATAALWYWDHVYWINQYESKASSLSQVGADYSKCLDERNGLYQQSVKFKQWSDQNIAGMQEMVDEIGKLQKERDGYRTGLSDISMRYVLLKKDFDALVDSTNAKAFFSDQLRQQNLSLDEQRNLLFGLYRQNQNALLNTPPAYAEPVTIPIWTPPTSSTTTGIVIHPKARLQMSSWTPTSNEREERWHG